MGKHKEKKRRTAKDIVPPILLLLLGEGAGIAMFFLIDQYRFFDLIVMSVAVIFTVIGYSQRIVRGVMSAAILYFASGVAATFYNPAAPYIGAPFGEEVTNATYGLSFCVLTAAVWIALEAIGRALFEDTSLPRLGFLDVLGGLLIYAAIGIVVATLIFNAAGYSSQLRPAHDRAWVRPYARQVLAFHYDAQSFWFRRPPPIYVYDLLFQENDSEP